MTDAYLHLAIAVGVGIIGVLVIAAVSIVANKMWKDLS